MKIHEIDNSLRNLGKTVLWQYDRAVRLLSLLKHMQVMFHWAVEKFWERWNSDVLSIDTCGEFGLSVWGIMLGVPSITLDNGDGTYRLMVNSVYRKVLRATFFWMKSDASYASLTDYLEILFGVPGDNVLSKWKADVSEYGWTTNVDELNRDAAQKVEYFPRLAYRQGIIFYYEEEDTNWLCLENITAAENTSLQALQELGKVQQTTEPATALDEPDTLVFKLFDPEGICRKIGVAPAGALSISIDYKMGETIIIAKAKRGCKCGVRLVDNGDMTITYEKSEFYDEMHRDQKALFEQKKDEYLPYPLGIKTNEPVGRWVFGVEQNKEPYIQSNVLYKANTAYKKDDIFGYVEGDNKGMNWQCQEDIPAVSNTSFDAIKDKLKKTSLGGTFVNGLAAYGRPFFYMSPMGWLPDTAMFKSKTKVSSVVPSQRLFVGLENGLYKIFRNTTTGSLVVAWSSLETSEVGKKPSLYYDAIGVEEPTIESINTAFAELARRNNCPVLNYSQVVPFIPGVQYDSGDVVSFNGEERQFLQSGKWANELEALAYTVSQRDVGLHEFYPFVKDMSYYEVIGQ